jgi:hypothetical protein
MTGEPVVEGAAVVEGAEVVEGVSVAGVGPSVVKGSLVVLRGAAVTL